MGTPNNRIPHNRRTKEKSSKTIVKPFGKEGTIAGDDNMQPTSVMLPK